MTDWYEPPIEDDREVDGDRRGVASTDLEDVVAPVVSAVPEKPGEIRSIEQLLRYAYSQSGSRFSVPIAVFAAIGRELDVDEPPDFLPLILELANSDPLLAVPPRLLVAVESTEVPRPLRQVLLGLTQRVLQQHLVLRASGSLEALNGADLDPEAVAASVRRLATTVEPAELGLGGELKEASRERLRINALTSLALYLAMARNWRVGDLVDCLDRLLWQEERRRIKGTTSLALLADTKTPEVLGIVAEVFARRLRDADRRVAEQIDDAAEAHRRMHEAQDELDGVRGEIERLEGLLNAARAETAELRTALEVERRDRAYDQAHHADDYEHLRGRMLRLLNAQRDLLLKALHALQNDRSEVTEEFIERVVAEMERTQASLSEGATN